MSDHKFSITQNGEPARFVNWDILTSGKQRIYRVMFDGTYALLHLYVKAGRLVSVDLYSLKTNKNIETMTFAQLRRLISSSEASFINGWQYSFHFKRPNPPPSHIVDNRFAIPIRSGSEEYLVHIEP